MPAIMDMGAAVQIGTEHGERRGARLPDPPRNAISRCLGHQAYARGVPWQPLTAHGRGSLASAKNCRRARTSSCRTKSVVDRTDYCGHNT